MSTSLHTEVLALAEPSVPFSHRLREGTKTAHREAEHAPFIQDFFRGRLSLEAYREYVLQLYFVYEALEEVQNDARVRDALGPLFTQALFRKEALGQDLNYLYGHAGWEVLLPLPSTQAYVGRIRNVAATWPEGVIAHHYTRYLGDLSGGQVLKRIAKKVYRLEEGQGLAFYDFPHLHDHAAFKQAYRQHLDTLELREDSQMRLVEEANRAFYFNRDVFLELGKP